MFKEDRKENKFEWNILGNISEGRPNLGKTMDIVVYRLMQFTLRDIMIKDFGAQKADEIFYEAGRWAGINFFNNVVTQKQDFNEFIKELQNLLRDLKIGILRVEKSDMVKASL